MKKIQLYLQTIGARLRVKDGLFEVSYKPKGKGWKKQQVAAVRVGSILLHRHCSLSVDSILLAVQHDIDIVVTDEYAQPAARVWHIRPSSTTAILKAQMEVSINEKGLAFAQKWVVSKLLGMSSFLAKLKVSRKSNTSIASAIAQIRKQAKVLQTTVVPAEVLRGKEGTASRAYFQVLGQLLPSDYRFDRRSRRPAADLFNAALNFGYGLLYKEVDKALVLAGLSPYVGFLHRDGYQHRALTFDFIEQYRVWVDRLVFKLICERHLNKMQRDTINTGFQLDAIGRGIVVQAFYQFLQEETMCYGVLSDHHQIIKNDSINFAQKIIS